jgi:pyruvate/2-oxoglutarate dehydrogenase complex dihydrolipoamide acyltransferase (E2) component
MRSQLLIALLTLCLGSTLVLLDRAVGQEATPTPAPSPTPAATPTPSATPAPSAAPSPSTAPSPIPAPPAAPEADPSPAAIGGLAGMSAFMACGYLGELAEGLERGREPAQVEARARALARGLIVNMRQLESVGEMKSLDPAGQAQLAALRRLLGALGEQAKSLELYALTQESTIADTYRELRQRTWTETGRLLGLDAGASQALAPGGANLGRPKPKTAPSPKPTQTPR